MKTITRLALAGLAGGGIAAAFQAQAQTPLTYSSWVPPTHHITLWQANWTKEVEKATGGRLKFQSLPKHPSAAPGTFDAVRNGLMDLSYVTASYTPARHVLPGIAELPGMGDTSVVNSIAYSRIHWKRFQQIGEYNGVKMLGVFTHGPGQMFTKKAIRKPAELQGLKFRTGGGVAERWPTRIGSVGFVKPAPESYELLKSGVADGTFFPLEAFISFKLETVTKEVIEFPGGMYSSSFGFFMNQGRWDKLSKQDQAAIEKLSREHVARTAGKSWDGADAKAVAAMKKAGVPVVKATPALIAHVRKSSDPIIEEWIAKANAKGVDAPRVLAEFRAELKKVAAEK